MFKLFVNIACFKDPDLINTINDAFSKAKYPERIYIGVSEQSETPNVQVQKIQNVRYKFTPSNFSKGTGWHRNEIYKEIYNGCLLYTSQSPRDGLVSRMPSSA